MELSIVMSPTRYYRLRANSYSPDFLLHKAGSEVVYVDVHKFRKLVHSEKKCVLKLFGDYCDDLAFHNIVYGIVGEETLRIVLEDN